MPYICFWFTQGLFNNIDRAGKGFLVFKVIKLVSASIPPETFQEFCCCKYASSNIAGFILIHAQQLRAASAWCTSCTVACPSMHYGHSLHI